MNALGKMLNMTNIRKIQVKSTVRYQFTPIGHILLKHLKITSVYQRYGEVGMPCIAGREVKQCGLRLLYLPKHTGCFQKKKTKSSDSSRISQLLQDMQSSLISKPACPSA